MTRENDAKFKVAQRDRVELLPSLWSAAARQRGITEQQAVRRGGVDSFAAGALHFGKQFHVAVKTRRAGTDVLMDREICMLGMLINNKNDVQSERISILNEDTLTKPHGSQVDSDVKFLLVLLPTPGSAIRKYRWTNLRAY